MVASLKSDSPRKHSAGIVAAVAFSVGLSVSSSGAAHAIEDVPTRLRPATVQDMTAGDYILDFGWFHAQDPHGLGLFQFTYLNHGMAGVKWGYMNNLNVNDPQGNYQNLVEYPASPVHVTDAPSIDSAIMHFAWDDEKQGWHLTYDNMGAVADLWFTNTHPGAAMDPVDWDGTKVFWASSIATADINGRIKFPGHSEFTEVNHWVGEQERMAGGFLLGPGHIGYDYAQAGNPDGSADQLFMFPEADGKVRGVLAHTAADGTLTMCEPKSYEQTDWDSISSPAEQIGPFDYPRTVSASCDDLSISFHVDQPHLFPLNIQLSTTTMSQGHSSVPGSRATIQHARDVGTGFTTGFPLYGFPNQPPTYWN